MLMCIDPDAIDTHKGRWLEIDSWLDGIVPVSEEESRDRPAAPHVLVAPQDTAGDRRAPGGVEPATARPLAA
jgi:hypothetical protein